MRAGRPFLLVPPIVALLVVALAVNAGAQHARPAASNGYSTTYYYQETNPGTDKGGVTVGIVGKGTFSAKLGAGAAIAAHIIGAVTGVPLAKIAQGGSYAVRRKIAANGTVTGLMAAKLKAHGLGTVCVSYTVKPGRFTSGSFVPMSGTLKVVGGTGSAARWRGGASFKQTSVTGSSVEQFTATGSEHGSTGSPKGLSAACKSVAKLPGG